MFYSPSTNLSSYVYNSPTITSLVTVITIHTPTRRHPYAHCMATQIGGSLAEITLVDTMEALYTQSELENGYVRVVESANRDKRKDKLRLRQWDGGCGDGCGGADDKDDHDGGVSFVL